MEALGFIETRGLIVAVESADAMLKAGNVSLLERTFVGGGLVSIVVSGEVSAVQAAVDAGAAAVRQLNHALLVSSHVIPRPDQEVGSLFVVSKPSEIEKGQALVSPLVEAKEEAISEPSEMAVEVDSENKRKVIEEKNLVEINLADMHQDMIDQIVAQSGLEVALEFLKELTVTKLRSLAREYREFGITGRLISKANKNKLLQSFKDYYEKQTRTLDE